jgi:hypothetical protein
MHKAFEVVYLAPESVHFKRDGDTLSLTVIEDNIRTHYPRVILRFCFPVSNNGGYLSIRDANDEKQREIGILTNWTELAPKDRQAVAAELGLHYFVPQVTRIHSIKEELGFLYWKVDTDKGPQEFVMRNSIIHNTRRVSPMHWLIIDINDARHEIPNVDGLDTRSQRLLEEFLSV